MKTFLAALGLAVVTGCGASNPHRVDPEEMSAEAHRVEAEREAEQARAEKARYNPAKTEPSPFRDRAAEGDLGEAVALHNPFEEHLRKAQWHVAHASAHKKAARKLETFEDEACAGVPARERGACPLLGPVEQIRDVAGGVAIDLSLKVNAAAAVASMRCHYAYARARGFAKEAAACPLYVRGLEIEQAGAHTIEITARDPATTAHVRQAAREDAGGAP